jgi:hypothetical protein
MTDEWNGFSLVFEPLDRVTRKYCGWVWRLHVNTPWWHLGIALRPADRFVQADGSASWFFTRKW